MHRLPALAVGALCLLTGVILLVWPGKTLLVLTALTGTWLVVIGVLRIGRAFATKTQSRRSRLLTGVSGLLYTVIGAVSLRSLFATVAMMSVIVGLVWIVGGVAEIAWRGANSVLLGLLSLAAGTAAFLWPQITVPVMAVIAGLWLAAFGAIQILYRPSEAR